MHSLRLPLAAALAAVLLAGAASPVRAQSYPRLGLYGSMFGDGYPLWDVSGVADPTVLDEIARFDEVVLDASPITPYRPDVALAIRARHPGIRMLAYVTGHSCWYAAQPDSTVHFPTRYWRTVRDLDGFLYNTSGGQYGSVSNQPGNVNLAKRDGSGRYIVAEAIADLFYDAVVRPGIWDGLFVDNFCDNMLWMEAAGEYVNFARAGYPNRTAFAAAWKVGSDTLASRLRRLSGSTQILVGNCAAGTKYAWFNGWMRENFPYQGGGTWYTNMYSDPGGYFLDNERWLLPRSNWIFSASSGLNTPYTATNTRKARFGLGSAALGDGYAVISPSARTSRPEQFMAWWYDEYAVDLASGQSSALRQHTGWLGQALGPYYQMVWVGPTPDIVTNPSFETDVTSGWNLFTVLGSVATRDSTTAPHGSSSVHITVPAADALVPWSTAFRTLGSMPVVAGLSYSATFWAKAAWPRSIDLEVGYAAGGGSYARSLLPIDTTWRRYQVVLQPYASGNARLDILLAGEVGDVWLDDVHFQEGVYGIFRRDFQNGAVLVNPGNTPLDVTMEGPFKRIRGLRDPAVNDGVLATTHTVQPTDALFLIGTDITPPAAVRDLHVVPFGTPTTIGSPPRDDR